MPAKWVELHEKSRVGITRGAALVAEAARVTLGPKGRNVLIQRSFGAPLVTKDGATVVKEIDLEDKFENIGAKLIREVAQKTADATGDGTTTATVLTRAMVRQGLKLLAAGMPPIELKRGMDEAVARAVEAIREMAKPIKDRLEHVATIAVNGDAELGRMIADAMREVGHESVITVEEGRGIETTLETLEGMRFDRGYVSPYFITNPEKQIVELENPLVLIHEKKIASLHEFVPVLEQVAHSGRPLLVIAEDVEGEALAAMVVNKLRGTISAAAVKAPSFGDRRKEMLIDMATLCGGELIAEEAGLSLEKVQAKHLGGCRRVVIDRDNTVIIGGEGKKADIQARIVQIRKHLEIASSDYDREKLQERLAKLSGGVAVLKVGAATETEVKEKKSRVEGAVNALHAAVEEGIVPGGGVALVRAIAAVRELKLSAARRAGADIVAYAMAEPLRQIAVNAGAEPEVVLNKVLEGKDDFGYNAATGNFEQLSKAGVIDPAKVVHVALENAVSISSMLLITEAAIAEKPYKEPAITIPNMAPGPGIPMGMGGMGGMGPMGGIGGMGGMGPMGGMGGMGGMGDDF